MSSDAIDRIRMTPLLHLAVAHLESVGVRR
jgi:hypothetical protein